MSWSLRFGGRLVCDPGQPSITLPVHLSVGQERLTAPAKLDTGASHSIFSREIGERLGLAVDAGQPLTIETVTGSFRCFGRAVTLAAVDIALDTTAGEPLRRRALTTRP